MKRIGNYLSQFAANLYLTWFDRQVKQKLKIKHYFRYCDDIVLFSSNKKELHQALQKIKEYMTSYLELEVKHDWQMYPVDDRGVDFLGYVFKHSHMKLRKDMKKSSIGKPDMLILIRNLDPQLLTGDGVNMVTVLIYGRDLQEQIV